MVGYLLTDIVVLQDGKALVHLNKKLIENFGAGMSVRHRCVFSLLVFIYLMCERKGN